MSELSRQTEALERIVRLLEHAVARQAALDRQARSDAARERAGLPERPLHRLEALGAGLGVPGLLGRFSRAVPESYLDGESVRCVCGTETPVPVAHITECSGGCCRWFLRARDRVWCASFPGFQSVTCGCGWQDFYAEPGVCAGCGVRVEPVVQRPRLVA